MPNHSVQDTPDPTYDRWEALEQKKCKENIPLLPTHNYIFASLGIKFLRINSASKNPKIEDIRALVQSSWTCSHAQRISSSLTNLYAAYLYHGERQHELHDSPCHGFFQHRRMS